MAMVINTNMASLNAVRLLDDTSREQKLSMEKLTSGMAINRAADDAAGLAVATGMTTQIRGTDQAIQNANDGISLVQTVDGAAEEVVDMLQRMRELAIQSLNGTYSDENRQQMDEEYTQLELEIDRVAVTTKFNETNLLGSLKNGSVITSGNISAVQLHVGWEVDVAGFNKISLGMANFATGIKGSDGGIFGNFTSADGTVVDDVALNTRDILTQATASAAVRHLDGALSSLSTKRAEWGALQNRLESTVSNLANVNENMNAARSRILDTDFAQESANLARTQVLQQAGMSMLSQANQQSQNVMQLLQ